MPIPSGSHAAVEVDGDRGYSCLQSADVKDLALHCTNTKTGNTDLYVGNHWCMYLKFNDDFSTRVLNYRSVYFRGLQILVNCI